MLHREWTQVHLFNDWVVMYRQKTAKTLELKAAPAEDLNLPDPALVRYFGRWPVGEGTEITVTHAELVEMIAFLGAEEGPEFKPEKVHLFPGTRLTPKVAIASAAEDAPSWRGAIILYLDHLGVPGMIMSSIQNNDQALLTMYLQNKTIYDIFYEDKIVEAPDPSTG